MKRTTSIIAALGASMLVIGCAFRAPPKTEVVADDSVRDVDAVDARGAEMSRQKIVLEPERMLTLVTDAPRLTSATISSPR